MTGIGANQQTRVYKDRAARLAEARQMAPPRAEKALRRLPDHSMAYKIIGRHTETGGFCIYITAHPLRILPAEDKQGDRTGGLTEVTFPLAEFVIKE